MFERIITPYYPPVELSPANLKIKSDALLEDEMQRLLHPEKDRILYYPKKVMELRVNGALELRKASVLWALSGVNGWQYAGKVLRPESHDSFRPASIKMEMLKACPTRNEHFAQRLIKGLGLAPIIYNPDSQNLEKIALGPFIDPTKEDLNPDLDFMWIMHRFPQSQTFNDVFTRNFVPWTLQTFAESLLSIHEKSEETDVSTAIQYASIDALADKYFLNLNIYQTSIEDLIERGNLPIHKLQQISVLKKLLDRVVSHPIFRQIVNDEIEGNNVVIGHGDTQLSNCVYTDLFSETPIEQPGELGIWYDAIDFNKEFYVQSLIGEDAMGIVDLLATVPQEQYAFFLRYYLKRMKITRDPKKRTFLLISMLDKAQVRAYNNILWDQDFEKGEKFITIVDTCIEQLETIFPDPNIFRMNKAMRAGMLVA